MLNSLARSLSSKKGLSQKFKDGLSRIDGVSVGPSGISVSAPKKPMKTLRDFLDIIGKEAGKCVIELDEIQELAVISGFLLKLLANIFNTYSNIIFVFTGSMFGLVKTLIEPKSSSPLYGRSPAKLYLRPFERKIARSFIKKGFDECNVEIKEEWINEVVENLDGIPGWLTLYGNNVTIRKLRHKDALIETISEGMKIVKDELDHFLKGRDRVAYISALKAASVSARWSEIKGAVEGGKGSTVNDGTIYNIIDNLKAAMIIIEEENVYKVNDPLMRSILIRSQIT